MESKRAQFTARGRLCGWSESTLDGHGATGCNVRQRVEIACTTDGTNRVKDCDALGRHAENCLGLNDDQVGLV